MQGDMGDQHDARGPDMAIRLEKVGRGSAEAWLRNQKRLMTSGKRETRDEA
jgi:hypothetical protein